MDTTPEKKPTQGARTFLIVVIVLILIALAPMAAGYRYQMLPLAYWSVGPRPQIVGQHMDRGHLVPTLGGTNWFCGFFALTKPLPQSK